MAIVDSLIERTQGRIEQIQADYGIQLAQYREAYVLRQAYLMAQIRDFELKPDLRQVKEALDRQAEHLRHARLEKGALEELRARFEKAPGYREELEKELAQPL